MNAARARPWRARSATWITLMASSSVMAVTGSFSRTAKKKGMNKGKRRFVNCLPQLENAILGNKEQRLLLMCDEENLLC